MKRARDVLKEMSNGHYPANTPTSSSGKVSGSVACRICGKMGDEAVCEGLGVLRYNVPLGDPNFGKLLRCPHNIVENDEARQEKLRKMSNLGAFADKSFENFVIDGPLFTRQERESLQTAFNNAVRYAHDTEGWLLLEGTYGCGKTHLAAAIANVRLRQGDAVLFITSPDLLDHLRSTFAPDSEVTYDDLFDRVRNTHLLILDDLGVENPSPWAQEKLFQLLNHRYNHNLPTVITSNTDVDDLDPRLRSRLLDNTRTHRVRITAGDYRTQRQDERTQLRSMLPLYAEMRFDTFNPRSNTQPEEAANLQKVLQLVRAYAQQSEDHWLLLLGAYGTGKTHLAAAIANYRADRAKNTEDVMFTTMPELMDYLRLTFNADVNVRLDQRIQQVKNVDLLVLDDLGAESSSSWAREKLFQIIDYRYVTRKATVLTTAKAIEKLDERILTRLLDRRLCTRVEILARSYAIRHAFT